MKMRTLAAVAAVALVTSACSVPDSEVVDEPVADSGGTEADEDDGAGAEDDGGGDGDGDQAEEPSGPAAPGDTVAVESSDADLEITLLDVFDPAEPGEFFEPDGRFIAVEVALENVGGGTYEDSLGNGSVLVDGEDRTYNATLAETTDCPTFASGSVTVAESDVRVGCITFDVPEDIELAAFEFTPDSGFAGSTARFDIAGYETGSAPPRDDLRDQTSTPAASAGIGDSIELESNSATTIETTVTQVFDPAAAGEFGGPDGRFVAVELRLSHTGGDTYEDSPSNGATLVDAEGRTYSTTLAESPDCPGFASGSVTLAPGDTRVGCVVFDVPEGVETSVFEFGLDSGFAPQTGRWSLGG